MQIIQQLNDSDYVVRMEDQDKREVFEVIPTKLSIAHDYVQFMTMMSIQTKDTNVKLTNDGTFNICANQVRYMGNVQIGIRKFFKVILPLLLKNEYLQKEHFAMRTDGSFGYTYNSDAVSFRNDDGIAMVAYREEGELEYSYVTQKVFDDYIKPGIIKKRNDKLLSKE